MKTEEEKKAIRKQIEASKKQIKELKKAIKPAPPTIPFSSRIDRVVLEKAIKKHGKSELRSKISKFVTKISK